MIQRIQYLKDKLRSTKPHICSERASLITEFYRRCSMDVQLIKRAKMLDYLLSNMTIYIADKELFVGNIAKEYRGVPVFPEFGSNWIIESIDEFATRKTDPLAISEETKTKLLEDLSFWKDQSFKELVDEKLSKEVLEAEKFGVLSVGSRTTSTGHVVPNYQRVLSLGLRGIINEAKEKRTSIKIVDHDSQRKIDFWDAIVIACEACIKFAHRYSDLAKEMAVKENDEIRQKELVKISENCGWVPENPPRTTYEAMQFFWFMHLIMQIETNGHSIGLGRFDQTMYPYYKKDKENGTISYDECIELIECLWIKITEIIKVRDSFDAQAFAGYPMWQNCVVGGVTSVGKDAVNEFSFCILDATEAVQTTQPTISFRYHDNINREFFRKALSMNQKGLATPAFFNDKLIIPLVLAKGAHIKEARDWSIEGCVENYVTGKTDGRPVVGYINTAKLVEFVLNDGLDPVSKIQIGLKTGDLTKINNYDDFMNAYKKQMEYFTKIMCEAYNIVGACHANMAPAIISSALVDDCIEVGKTLQEGGAKYNFSGSFITALANTADSIAAIDKLIFNENKITLEELVAALRDNFEGREVLRQMLINKAPKYGNDDDYVDEIARQIVEIAVDEVEKYTDSRNGRYVLSVLSQSFNVMQGKSVGATPDGRLAYEPLSNNASPAVGRDMNGPTASVNSVAKTDQFRALTGSLLNIKFDPAIVKVEKGVTVLGSVVKSYFDEYGEHIQMNIVSEETLKDAQKRPEKYPNLMVRVAGYSAYFIELDKEVQEDVIKRTAHTY